MNAIIQELNPASQLSATVALATPSFQDPIKVTRATLDLMLEYCLQNKVDDLCLLAGAPWAVIWSEGVRRIGSRLLYTEELEQLLNEITSNTNAALMLSRANDLDFAYNLKLDGGRRNVRFRVNATACLAQSGAQGLEIVFRPAGKIPPTCEQLGLPSYIIDAIPEKQGLVLVCGPTGSGKTTMLDSMIRKFATDPVGRHILTYYSPIENDLNNIPGITGLIAQTEIGVPGLGAHLTSFGQATRNSLRRHPMVLAYGEARDRETIEGAVLSAMTGHITLTTTHTSNVHMAIPRMSDAFEGADRVRINNALIDNTRLIVHQRLVKRPDGIGRAPVRSALAMTRDIRTDLLKTHIDHLPAAMLEITNAQGIGLLDDARREYEKGNVHQDELHQIESELASEGL